MSSERYIKTPQEIEIMAQGGKIAGEILAELITFAKVGMETLELEAKTNQLIKQHGVTSSFNGFYGYPYSLVVCLNDEVVHGMPSKRIIADGDVLTVDFGSKYKGFHADTAFTLQMGKTTPEVQRFLTNGYEALKQGISAARPGNHLGDIGHAIQTTVENGKYNVVRMFVGHGVGKELQEDPQVPGFGAPGRGLALKAGMVLAIEVMYSMGDYEVEILDDEWTAVTADGSLAGMFEHTVAITENGPRILTRRPGEQI